MDNRIRDIAELFDECWFKNADSQEYGKLLSIDDSMGYSFDAEKFAEMVAKQCIAICHNNMGHSESYNSAILDCAENIKKHFGVTE